MTRPRLVGEVALRIVQGFVWVVVFYVWVAGRAVARWLFGKID